MQNWSSVKDREFWDVQFALPSHDPFSPSYPGRVTIRRFSDLAEPRLDGVAVAYDLGCGPGELTCELARRRRGTRFVGVDHSQVAIEQARAHAARLDLDNVEFQVANLEAFELPDDVGLVTMFDSFHHVLDPDGFISRLSRACDRFFLIEPAGNWLGAWDRRHDLDWLPATVFQLGDRLEFEFGLLDAPRSSPPARNQTTASSTEHRYTASDLEKFFQGFSLEMRGTIAGLEQYGPDPSRRSRLRDRFGDAAYQLVVAIDDAMYEEGLDLAAKHWAIYASRARDDARALRREIRRPPERPLTRGLLPEYGARYDQYSGPQRVKRGEVFQASVRVKNTGWRPWSSVESPPVMMSYHWRNATGRILVQDGLRTPLGLDVAPGEERALLVRVQALDRPGSAVLSIDLVHENVTWFSDQGVRPCDTRFVIEP